MPFYAGYYVFHSNCITFCGAVGLVRARAIYLFCFDAHTIVELTICFLCVVVDNFMPSRTATRPQIDNRLAHIDTNARVRLYECLHSAHGFYLYAKRVVRNLYIQVTFHWWCMDAWKHPYSTTQQSILDMCAIRVRDDGLVGQSCGCYCCGCSGITFTIDDDHYVFLVVFNYYFLYLKFNMFWFEKR